MNPKNLSAVIFMAALALTASPSLAQTAEEDLSLIPAIPAHLMSGAGGEVRIAQASSDQFVTQVPYVQTQFVQMAPVAVPTPPYKVEIIQVSDDEAVDLTNVMASVQAKKSRRAAVSQAAVSSGETVRVAPGRNVVLVVAGNNLNRILTPFQHPVVNTVSNAKLKVDGSILYVSLGLEDGATTLFISEEGEPEQALSVTLMPQQVPPREIKLTLEGGWPVRSGGTKAAAKWEKSEPYLDAVSEVIMRIARAEMPQGYNMRRPEAHDPRPRSSLPVLVEPAQVLEGHNLLVVVSRLTNQSSGQLMVDESSFYGPGVRAVAVWPKVQLRPRESTELFVVFGRNDPHSPKNRPSVLTAGWAMPPAAPAAPVYEPGPRQQPAPTPEPEPGTPEMMAMSPMGP